MKLFRLFQKSPSSNTQSISCCEQTQFDCNQGRNCPLRTSAPSCPTQRHGTHPAVMASEAWQSSPPPPQRVN